MGYWSAIVLGCASLVAISALACDGDGRPDAANPTAPASTVTAFPDNGDVSIIIAPGCDRPQPELGTEALALVRVTDAAGDPVIEANVEGTVEGPAVSIASASDVTSFDGEALLFFLVTAPGDYTMTVTGIRFPDGTPARFEPAGATIMVTEAACVRPALPPL